ncbi:glutamate--tRNA ligase [Kiloniella sp. EL199]|uniref:glutamate--tRNA ligase n=1 Tax=Kiloniella sp. EL199 TaxID=2107581 RepID=UPI000EA369D8|nr:glutamate--tRNA ligase [Kiloniella sp. EL199]
MSHPTKQVVTRFAPSPTGFLHIGGARTALFNWLFAKHHGGKYLLRIEDTDRKRSTPEAIEAIIDGLDWLGLKHDDEITYQFARAERHQQVAQQLLSEGKAYHCYCSPEELTEMRETARAEGRPMKYDGRWRDRPASEAPEGVKPVVRLKMPQEGETLIKDLVQGDVTVANSQLDDMVLLRADGTPTYMLSVVVDDHDMGITHIIRGDDHLTNAFRQTQLFKAMGWELPDFAHIPLIHGADGAKLSKRHGALGVEAYRDEMGYLPEALRNYLLRLGWGHGDEEVISTEQAIKWYDIDGVGKSPSRFDFAKLENLNGIYIRNADDSYLADIISPLISEKEEITISADQKSVLVKGMAGLKERAKTIIDLADSAAFYVKDRPLRLNDKAKKLLSDEGKENLKNLLPVLQNLPTWEEDLLENTVKSFAEEHELKLGKVAQPLRAALSGSNVSPGIFEVMAILGKDESINRITDQV